MTDPIISPNLSQDPARRPVDKGGDESRGGIEHIVLSSALALLRDPSPVVRRDSAEYVRARAPEVKALPPFISDVMLVERDEVIVQHLISAVPRFSGGAHSLVSTLLFLAHDNRESIAETAARSLGELGQLARGAFVPMWMSRGLSPSSREDYLREVFEGRLSNDARRMYHAVGAGVDEISSTGHKALLTILRVARQQPAIGVTEVPQLAVLYGLCGVSDEARSEALRLCRKHPSAVGGGELPTLEPALATAMVHVGRPHTREGLASDFFHACAQLGPMPSFAGVLAGFNVGDNIDLKLLRDFCVASALREGDATAPLERTKDELWNAEHGTVRSAASNLAVLVPQLSRAHGEKIVCDLFEALKERASDGRHIVDALVTGISMIDGLDPEVVSQCGQIIASHGDDGLRAAIADVLGRKAYSCDASRQRAGSILQYLARDGSRHAAEVASWYLRS